MASDGLAQYPPVLAERLAVSAVVFSFDRPEEPPQLFDRGLKPFVVGPQNARTVPELRRPIEGLRRIDLARAAMRLDRRGDPCHRPSNLLQCVVFEEDEVVAHPLEPVDERIESLRRPVDVYGRRRLRHSRACGGTSKAIAATSLATDGHYE